MAIIMYQKDRKKLEYISKDAVRRILAARDEVIDNLHEMHSKEYDSARHRFVKLHQAYSRVEKLERQRINLIGGLLGSYVLFAIIWCCSSYAN